MHENCTLTWLITDHLGSTSVSVNASGNLVSSLRYTTFGEVRAASGTTATDYRYTGQRNETEIGLYYYVARFYDPALGRFVSADSIVPDVNSPQDWDRYAYVSNNPVNFSDPTGHDVGCPGYDASHCKSKSNAPAKRPNSPIPPIYRNPIRPQSSTLSQGFSWRAAPTNTPTPQTVIGPDPSKTPLPSSTKDGNPEQKISIDWKEVDYIDLSIDALGIVGEVALVVVEPGPGLIIDGAVTVVAMAGAGKTMYEIYQKDYSGVSTFTVDIAVDIVENNPLVKARLGRAIPFLGVFANSYSIYSNLNPQRTQAQKE